MKKQSSKLNQLLNDARKQIDAQHWSAALPILFKVLPLAKGNAAILYYLGCCYMKLGQLDKALAFFELTETLASNDVVILCSMGTAYIELYQWPAALRVLLLAVELDASYIGAYLNLAVVYYNFQDHKKSLDVCLQAILIDASNVNVHLNMGAALLAMGFLKEAKFSFETCLTLQPHSLNAQLNLALISSREGDSLKAISEFRSYLLSADLGGSESKPDAGRYFLSTDLLNSGQLKEGWQLYDYGFHHSIPAYAARAPARRFLVPKWTGQPIPGKRLLVWAEQGIGDEIMFLSCMRDVLAVCDDVILECAPRLVTVMTRSFPSVTVRSASFDQGSFNASVFNDFDHHIPLGSLPGLYRQTLKDFDHFQPYVISDEGKKDQFRQRLAAYQGKLKVGICWRSGLLNAERNKNYSEINDWGDLLKLPNCVFVNLQYGDCEAEIAEVEVRFGISILRWSDLDLKNDMDGVFALIDCLDLVVTAGTSVNPMAGSLGKATLLIQSEWNWTNLGTSLYPWFPNTRCFVPEWDHSPAEVLPQLAEFVAKLSG